jgi:hypothetical protein
MVEIYCFFTYTTDPNATSEEIHAKWRRYNVFMPNPVANKVTTGPYKVN